MVSGFFNVIKPTGMTSSDVVVKVRGIAKRYYNETIKIGHFGTLDPAGAGVLPLAIGRATRLFDYATKERKIYRAGFCFGTATDTIDSYGKVTKTDGYIPDIAEILAILPRFIGDIVQIPPAYSSKNIDGKRAYDLARQGVDFSLQGRNVTVYDITYVDTLENSFVFDIECSGGTYIRSLVRDIADALNTVAYMSFIIRLQSGIFCLCDSVTIDDVAANPSEYLLPINSFTDTLPRVNVAENLSEKVLNGVKIKYDNLPEGCFTVYIGDMLLGIGINENGLLKVATRLI